MPTSSRTTVGVVVFALLAIVDISWMIQDWSGLLDSADAPPTGVLVLFALVGAVTLATVRPAQQGHRTAAWIMVGSRVVSVLLIDLPTYALGAPAWVMAIASVAILLTALGLWWTAPLLSRDHAAGVASQTAA